MGRGKGDTETGTPGLTGKQETRGTGEKPRTGKKENRKLVTSVRGVQEAAGGSGGSRGFRRQPGVQSNNHVVMYHVGRGTEKHKNPKGSPKSMQGSKTRKS